MRGVFEVFPTCLVRPTVLLLAYYTHSTLKTRSAKSRSYSSSPAQARCARSIYIYVYVSKQWSAVQYTYYTHLLSPTHPLTHSLTHSLTYSYQ